jgi:hypothetical protein
MLEKKLKKLRKYLKENLNKGFIRELESLAGFPVLFILKKDSKLQPCIRY